MNTRFNRDRDMRVLFQGADAGKEVAQLKINYIDDEQAHAAEPREKPYRLSAGFGLWLKVMPTGNKLWSYRYRYQQRETSLALGAFPKMSTAAAKGIADNARELLSNGRNPAIAKANGKL